MFRVLIVDDEESIRWMVSVLLRQQGYEVADSSDGGAALRMLDDSRKFDLIITNIQMPGMNGLSLLSELRQSHPEIPHLIMSAYLEQPVVRALDKHIVHLAKPFSRQQLLEAVRSFSTP